MKGFLPMFKSIMGDVENPVVLKALELMLYGMAGIFVVMILIFAVIAILNRATKPKDGKDVQ